MGSATVQWIGGKRFVGIDSTNHSVVLSTADEGVGMKPSELLLVALASCTSVDVVEIMTKKHQPLASLNVQINGEQESDPPWTYRKIHVKYIVSGKNIIEKDLIQAIALSDEKYCSVAATVKGKAEVTSSYEIVPVE
jgi:putative redox protein